MAKKYTVKILLIFCLISSLLFGCSNRVGIKQPQQSYGNGSSSQSVENQPVVHAEYLLGFGDEIEVRFFNNARFNETITVRPDGRITLEKVGDIYVSGMTPSGLDSIITNSYSDLLINPEVTIFVRQFGGYNVYLLGEVNEPGGYPITRNMTILQAIAQAGGAKDSAKLKSVMILRLGQDEQIEAIKVNLKELLKGANIPNQYYLRPQDIVYVPKTFIAGISSFLKQVYDGAFPPVDIYLRVLFWTK